MKVRRIIAIAGVTLLSFTILSHRAGGPEPVDKLAYLGSLSTGYYEDSAVLATFQGQKVTASMVSYKQEAASMTYSSDGSIHADKPPEKEVVDQILRAMILLYEAERAGLAATEEQINADIEEQKRIAAEYPEVREQLETYWEAAGMTEETYWTHLRQSSYEGLTVANFRAVLMTEYEEAGMTEEEAKAAYEAYKNGLIETHQDQITYYLDAS